MVSVTGLERWWVAGSGVRIGRKCRSVMAWAFQPERENQSVAGNLQQDCFSRWAMVGRAAEGSPRVEAAGEAAGGPVVLC